MASIVCLYMVSSCRCMLSNSQTKNGLASTSNSNELDAVLFLVLPWNVSCPKVLNFRLVIHKQRSLTFSSGHPVCSLHIKFSLFYQPCHVHSWATTLLERVWQRLRVGVACFGCGNELFFIYNHGHIFLTFRFTLERKKRLFDKQDSPGEGGGVLLYKSDGGCSSENFENTSKRYQNLVLWACANSFSALGGTNSTTTNKR